MNKIFHVGKSTLRVRLTAWYILLVSLSLALFSGYVYLQLQQSLLTQLDTTLKITAVQTLDYLVVNNTNPAFQHDRKSETIIHPLAEAGVAMRLISNDGRICDGFGNYEDIPFSEKINTGFASISSNNTMWRLYSQPLKSSGNDCAWLQVAESLKHIYQASEHLLAVMVFGFPLVILATGLGGIFLAERALSPINRIIHTAQAISINDFTKRIGYQGPMDEVGRLAMTLDRMLDRLQEAFEHERRFIADAAHELRTPLTVIKGRIGVSLSRSRTPGEYEKTLENLEQEADRLIRLTNGLLFLARLDLGSDRPSFSKLVDLSNFLWALVEQIQPLAEAQQINLDATIAPDLFIQGNCDYLTNLFLNLLDNALKYTPSGGTVNLEARRFGKEVWVSVRDTGMGIEAKHLSHLFDRFYRVESARSRNTGGAGLGLAIANCIARLHGGILTAQSQLGKGATFTLSLPCVFGERGKGNGEWGIGNGE